MLDFLLDNAIQVFFGFVFVFWMAIISYENSLLHKNIELATETIEILTENQIKLDKRIKKIEENQTEICLQLTHVSHITHPTIKELAKTAK